MQEQEPVKKIPEPVKSGPAPLHRLWGVGTQLMPATLVKAAMYSAQSEMMGIEGVLVHGHSVSPPRAETPALGIVPISREHCAAVKMFISLRTRKKSFSTPS